MNEVDWLRAENAGLKDANERCGKYLAEIAAELEVATEKRHAEVHSERLAIIEECARVVELSATVDQRQIAAAIRALKEKP